MNSIITKNSFAKCTNLKQIYIGENTNISPLDLSQTSIKTSLQLKDYQANTNNIIYADASIIKQTKYKATYLTNLINKLKQLDININSSIVKDEENLQKEFTRQDNQRQNIANYWQIIAQQLNSSEPNKTELQNKVNELTNYIISLQEEFNQISKLTAVIKKSKQDLSRERSSWTNWIKDINSNFFMNTEIYHKVVAMQFREDKTPLKLEFTASGIYYFGNLQACKQMIKRLVEYYQDKEETQ